MNHAAGPAGGQATYIIVLRHVLVAQDIAMTVAEFDPGAQVLIASTPGEAEALLAGIDRLALAFIGLGPEAYRASPLSGTVAACGGRAVLMGEEAEAEGEAQGFAVLARPFTTATILGHLVGA